LLVDLVFTRQKKRWDDDAFFEQRLSFAAEAAGSPASNVRLVCAGSNVRDDLFFIENGTHKVDIG
jgi:hypothetical protein